MNNSTKHQLTKLTSGLPLLLLLIVANTITLAAFAVGLAAIKRSSTVIYVTTGYHAFLLGAAPRLKSFWESDTIGMGDSEGYKQEGEWEESHRDIC